MDVPSSMMLFGLNLLIKRYKNSACLFGAMPYFAMCLIGRLFVFSFLDPAPKSVISKTELFCSKLFLIVFSSSKSPNGCLFFS